MPDYKKSARDFAERLASDPHIRWVSGDELKGRCPREAHDDRNPSFGYNVEKDAWACSCGGGKGSELRAEMYGTPGSTPAPVPMLRQKSGKRQADVTVPDREPDETYEYDNGNRKVKWRVKGKRSIVRWRHQDGTPGKKGEVGIYRLDKIGPAEIVHLSESESDVNALAEKGFYAISTPHGAQSPLKEVPEELTGKIVVVWEHQDPAGREYAKDCVSVLVEAEIQAVICRPPRPHSDVRDWINDGAKKEKITSRFRVAIYGFDDPEWATNLAQADIPDLEYIIKPIASRGNLTVLQGETKAGKSCFALLAAIAAAIGEWKSGRWTAGPKPKMTLFVTWEDGRRRVKSRIKQYIAGFSEDFKHSTPADLRIYASDRAPRIRLNEPSGVEMLRTIIKKYKVDFLVLDTLSHLSSCEENSKTEMQPVMDALKDAARDFNCAIMLIHHASKPSKDGSRSIAYRSRGSSAISAAADVILDWGKRDGNVTSCSFISKDDDGDRFQVEYIPEADGDVIRWRLSDQEEDSDKYGTRKKIIETLSDLMEKHPEGANRGQIAATSGVSKNTAVTHLETLAEEGSIQKFKGGKDAKGAWLYAPITHVIEGGE